MSRKFLMPGGPHQVRQIATDQYELSIDLPKNEDGRLARQCPNVECSPGYFKVKLGTGIINGQTVAFCPYCRHSDKPQDFGTPEQRRYAKEMALREVHKGLHGMIKDTLGLDPSGKRKLGGGLVSIEMSYTSAALPYVSRPFEDEVRRDVLCPHCSLDQTVFGLAAWCADCGRDIFLEHVTAELHVVQLMVEDVSRREASLGKRVAAKDLENCLEDIVSLFEAASKELSRRALVLRGVAAVEVEVKLKRVGNAFQSIPRARATLRDLFDFDWADENLLQTLTGPFEKRHPVAHNLGVIDRKYLERVQANEQMGREVRITVTELIQLVEHVHQALGQMHAGIIPKECGHP